MGKICFARHLGLEAKRRSPFRTTLLPGRVNNAIGYLPFAAASPEAEGLAAIGAAPGVEVGDADPDNRLPIDKPPD